MFDQEVRFSCPFYLPVDFTLMPTGEVLSVSGTPFDFTTSKPIGQDLSKVAGGYDHCLVVKRGGRGLDLLCRCHDTNSERRMEVWTNQAGVQFYSGNIGHFLSCILRPGQQYHHRSVHRFSV